MQRNFTGVTVDAPANGQQVWEPWFLEFPDQVNYRFFYTSYIQAYQIEKWVPNIGGQGGERPIAYTWYESAFDERTITAHRANSELQATTARHRLPVRNSPLVKSGRKTGAPPATLLAG